MAERHRNETSGESSGAVREARRSPLAKRFYKTAEIVEKEEGFSILLDGRPVRTPAKRLLALPTAEAAERVAEEWRGQGERIDPATMPTTRLANTALDGVADNMQAVLEDLLRYAANDLLCYRAGYPEGLVARQNAAWDPILDWAATTLGVHFETGEGIVHIPQPKAALDRISAHFGEHREPVKLASLHTMTTLTGSALIALALAKGFFGLDDGWRAAHVDEDWNIAQWGEDYEAAEVRAARYREMAAAYNLFRAL